jgi:hypothetical protein
VIGLSTSTWRYERQPDPINTQLLVRLTVHASERPRFGYRRLHTLVDREGLHVNHKRVCGVYRQAKLQVRRRRRKRLTRGQRLPLTLPTRRTERWSMDFMLDTRSIVSSNAARKHPFVRRMRSWEPARRLRHDRTTVSAPRQKQFGLKFVL